MKVKLTVLVIPFSGPSFFMERYIELPCVAAGMTIYSAQHSDDPDSYSEDTVESVGFDLLAPDVVVANLGTDDFGSDGYTGSCEEDCCKSALLSTYYRDWKEC